MTPRQWKGATPEEWAALGTLAANDLLPVVSNTALERGKFSRMKSLGKTPSLIIRTADGPRAIGFKGWTEHQASPANLKAWAAHPDHGICLQTRRIRALDIDVDDESQADEIEAEWLRLLGVERLPCRMRSNSGKRVLIFVVEGGDTLRRASFAVKEWEDAGVRRRWLVELLAWGQQFVAAGEHVSGVRYEWRDGLPTPDDLITVDHDVVVMAFDEMEGRLGLPGSGRRASRREPTLVEDLEVEDPIAEYLIDSGWPTYGVEGNKLYLDCPAKHLHSADNGESETCWLLAGTGKYRNGHFSCRHESCKDDIPGDAAFLNAVGYRPTSADDFEVLTDETDAVALYLAEAPGASPRTKELRAGAKQPLPGFNRDNQGRIETSLENIVRGLKAARACGFFLIHDELGNDMMIAVEFGQWRPLTDADAVELRIRLEALGFKDKIGKEMMRDALVRVAADSRFDSAIDWLMKEVPDWDGVKRIERFWPDYINTKDTPYTRALGLYSWTAQAARVLDPGCQVDMVPVLVSPEGFAKTSVIAAIAPSRQFFSEFSFETDEKERARLIVGCLVGELSELRGVAARDGESIKSWITRRDEEWVPKFLERKTRYRRRLVFYGTTNDPEFLQAHMGQRRWLPVEVLRKINVSRIVDDRLQLWAEARDRFLVEGVAWEDVERLANEEREAFAHVDPWTDRIVAWLDEPIDIGSDVTPRSSGILRSEDVLIGCILDDATKVKKVDQMRVGRILSSLGMVRGQKWLNGRNQKVWTMPRDDAHDADDLA